MRRLADICRRVFGGWLVISYEPSAFSHQPSDSSRKAESQELKAESFAPVLPPLGAPDWTPELQGQWAQFLASPAGQALWQRFAAVEFLHLRGAAHVHAPGNLMQRAGGFAEARAYLESLSRASLRDIEDENTGRPEGEPGIRERFTP